jgi:hypothetical protein
MSTEIIRTLLNDKYDADDNGNESAVRDLLIDLLIFGEKSGIDINERLDSAHEVFVEEKCLCSTI